jgi:hypothetical protein
MVKGIKFRRGTTADHSTFTGQEGEITVDITKDVAIVHDGTTVGGFPLVGETATQRITNKDINATALNVIGVITATSFIGDGSQLTGIVGSGIVIKDDGILIGTASTIDFGANLSVSPVSAGIVTVTASGGSSGIATYANTAGIATYSTTAGISTVAQNLTGSPNITVSSVNSSGVVTATSFSGSNTLKSRSTVIGITTSIPNNGIGNTNITGFKSYTLMKVGLSTAGWLRLYTDNASRISDASRSIGIDPSPGNGIIVEVITTGISTTQIISPFVMGGNLDDPASTTIYAAVTNLSGVTTSISVNLTLLQLEA